MGPGRLSQSLLLRCRQAAAAAAVVAARCRPLSARPLSAAAVRLRAPQRPPGRGEPPRAGGGGRWKEVAGAGGDEEDEEEEEEEEAELEELLGPSPLALGPGAQRVAVVHPAVKWGPKKPPLTTGAWPRRGGGGGRAAYPPRGPAGSAALPLPSAASVLLLPPPAPLQRSSARGKTRREPVPVAWSRAVIAVVELRNVAGADERKANSDQRSGAPFPSAGTF